MLRVSLMCFSNSLHSNTPFIHASLQLMKLHLLHKNALEEDKFGSSSSARDIEHTFRRELDTYRAVFTLSAHLESAKLYSNRILSAMRHFGMADDPLVRQIEKMMGKHSLHVNRRTRDLRFKGVTTRPSKLDAATASAASYLLPAELPNMAPVESSTKSGAGDKKIVQVPTKHRGHWVLRDPDIAMSKQDRRYDAW